MESLYTPFYLSEKEKLWIQRNYHIEDVISKIICEKQSSFWTHLFENALSDKDEFGKETQHYTNFIDE